MRKSGYWRRVAALTASLALALPTTTFSANHREAPITALDHKADITDVYAFVSYGEGMSAEPSHVTMILAVDPLLEPANGPTLFPFDPGILYEIKVDNNQDAEADVVFQFRFETEYGLPGVYTAVAGVGDGANAPGTDTLVVPPRITSFDSPGLNQRQSYTVSMTDGRRSALGLAGGRELVNSDGGRFYAVPGNAGERTMDYGALFEQAVYTTADGVKVFAGTTDDAFWIDLGAAFDTANFRTLGSGVPGVLTAEEDAAAQNFASPPRAPRCRRTAGSPRR